VKVVSDNPNNPNNCPTNTNCNFRRRWRWRLLRCRARQNWISSCVCRGCGSAGIRVGWMIRKNWGVFQK